MPDKTAENGMKEARVRPAIKRASVVLPQPGGPQRMSERSSSASMARRSGEVGPKSAAWTDDLVERTRTHPIREGRT
jgi:hypothetical protein